jgi:catechol 2,3-dioxygenase-like lactoylglutathione lyase family enzyme
MATYTGINHLAMVTRDMDKTIRFWRDLLEMRLVAGLGGKGYRHYFFELSEKDMIAFFEWPDVEAFPLKDHGVPTRGPLVFDHVSFGVSSDDDLWDLKGRLERAGFWVSELIDHGFIHSIYTFDPNHIPIEFSSTVPEVNLREKPRMMDRTPCQSALEGPLPQEGKWSALEVPVSSNERAIYPGEGTLFSGQEEATNAFEASPKPSGNKEVR